MKANTKHLLAMSVAVGLGASVFFVPMATSNPFSGPFGSTGGATSSEVLTIVQDAGTLARADEDLYASTFVSTGFSADGGTGGYALMCNGPECRYKFAEGSSMELVCANNSCTFNLGDIKLPTTFALAYACKSNQDCFLYSDPGSWMYFAGTTDTSGCTAGKAGGVKFRSTDSRLVNCDGTDVRPLTREVDGAVQLPSYTTANLPAATTAGRLVYDTDDACVKRSNGSSWDCLAVEAAAAAPTTLDFGSIASLGEETLTLTATGAVTTDIPTCTTTDGDLEAGLVLRKVRVTALNTISVTVWNATGGAINPDPLNFACKVLR